MTASSEQVELIHKIGNFDDPPQRDTQGRITRMQSGAGFVEIDYEAGEEAFHEVIATPEGPVISPIPIHKDFAGQQLFSVIKKSPDRPLVYITLFDPDVRLLPEDSDEPTRAVVIDREGRTVIFDASSVKIRSAGLPEDAQD